MKWISDWIIQTHFLALTLPDSPAVFTNLSASNSAHCLISSDICKMKETRVKLVHPKQILWNITRLILPVVKVGLTAERTSFHSSSRIKLIILRKYLLLTSKDLKKNHKNSSTELNNFKIHPINLHDGWWSGRNLWSEPSGWSRHQPLTGLEWHLRRIQQFFRTLWSGQHREWRNSSSRCPTNCQKMERVSDPERPGSWNSRTIVFHTWRLIFFKISIFKLC